MEASKSEPRRRHSASLKMQVVAECDVPGASVARVAMAHGVNANLVHKWRREQQARSGGTAAGRPVHRSAARPPEPSSALRPPIVPTFVPMAMPVTASSDIRVEIRRGGNVIHVSWPTVAAQGCAAWLQALLR